MDFVSGKMKEVRYLRKQRSRYKRTLRYFEPLYNNRHRQFRRDDLLKSKTWHSFLVWECVSDRNKEMRKDPSAFGTFSQMKPGQPDQSVGGLVAATPL